MKKKDTAKRVTTSCGGVVYRIVDGIISVLLIKQFAHKDSWGIPKGHVNEGESFANCALREVREETGVEAIIDHSMQLPNVTFTTRDNEEKTVVSWFMQESTANQQLRLNDPDCEVADVRWFRIDELPKIVVYQRPLLAQAINLLQLDLQASKKLR